MVLFLQICTFCTERVERVVPVAMITDTETIMASQSPNHESIQRDYLYSLAQFELDHLDWWSPTNHFHLSLQQVPED